MRSLVFVFGCLLLGSLAVAGAFLWQRGRASPEGSHQPPPVETTAAATVDGPDDGIRVHFAELARQAGIAFRHEDGRTPMHYFPEVMGGGVAWIDYDQDGYPDLFLVQGGTFPPDLKTVPKRPTSRLYRNQGDGTFKDVTEAVGI